MSPLSVWNPTLCSLQLVFSRPAGSSIPLQAGSTYQGTSVIRYRLDRLTEEETAIFAEKANNRGTTNDTSSLSEYEDFLRHRCLVAEKQALHLHALTTPGGLYKDAKPLQVTNYQVSCVSSSPSSSASGGGAGKCGPLKVVSVEQEDAGAVASPTPGKAIATAADKKQKGKAKGTRKKNGAAAEPEEVGDAASVDRGSKLVLFEGAETLPLYSEVELTVQFTGTVQSFDRGGIYAAKTENAAEDAPLLTHLEVRYARCAFPCPDDPQYRLEWQLKSLQLPDSYTAVLTNGEEQGRKELPSQHAVQLSYTVCGPLPAYTFSFACFPEPLDQVEMTLDIPEIGGDVAQGLTCRRGNLSCVSIPVRVLARRQARIPAATLDRALRTTQEAVTALQQLFDCPLPLLQCRHLDVLLGPTMPFISGMEHHCSIILNETIYQPGKKPAEAEQTELIVHELTHHWMGNALGLPFPVKEGICQVVEQCLGDTLLGKPMRKFKADSVGPVASANANGDAAAAPTTTTTTSSNPNTIRASEKGHEFTGTSYQLALSAMRQLVADRGFDAFGNCLRRVVHMQVVVPTVALEEQGGAQTLRCIGAAVPPPPYLSTEDFVRAMDAAL